LLVPTSDLAAVDAAVRRFAAEVVDLPHAAGVSCGIASTRGQVGSARLLFAAADRAMYHAKKLHLADPHHLTVQPG
ncbi:MAG: hypothetical protein QOD68_2785, partial [Actinomycetota bacterium]|nr:hypothetical protein [Actinomycetota bacterium]